MNRITDKTVEKLAVKDTSEVLIWNARFETGIPALDQQHRKLVDLINALSRIPLAESVQPVKCRAILAILAELENYVQYHFGFEAGLMRYAQLGHELVADHIEAHKKEHGEFMGRITEAFALAQSRPLEAIAGIRPYLSRWLLEHIVGMDIVMAGHIRAAGDPGAQNGTSTAPAYGAGNNGGGGREIRHAMQNLNAGSLSAVWKWREPTHHYEQLARDYAAAFNLIPGSVFTWRVQQGGKRGFEYVNEAFCNLLDVARETLRGDYHVALSAIHARDRHTFARRSVHAMRCAQSFSWEGRISVDGEVRWVSVRANPLAQPDGGCRWVGMVAGISAPRRNKVAVQAVADARQHVQACKTRNDACAQCASSQGLDAKAGSCGPHAPAADNPEGASVQELTEALERDQFGIVLQPQLDRLHRIVGAEVLLRWQHPERGMLSPVTFIPALEASGLIIPVGERVIEMACHQLAQWSQSEALRKLTLSVNVSARQFHDAGLAGYLQDAIARHGINPRCLKLELTESLLLQDSDGVIENMAAMRHLGLQLSLDDFGTGYSSLQYLRRLPLDQIKVDRAFVRNIALDNGDLAILHSIIELADSLGLDVVAEGVETEAQKKLLSNAGCSFFQGYLFGRPMPVEQFEAAVHARMA